MTDQLVILSVPLLVALVVTPFIILRRRKARQHPPAPAPLVDLTEAAYARAHGLTLQQWATLTPRERANLRSSAAHGQNRTAA